jgi:hypothetical protein
MNMFLSERRLQWCWYCDSTCQFVYEERKNKWFCTRCGNDLRHWGRQVEKDGEGDLQWRNKHGRMAVGVNEFCQREYPRFIVELPIAYSRSDREEQHEGIATNASKRGLLVHLSEVIEKRALLKIVILLIKGSGFDTVKGTAKVVWGDLATKLSWRMHRCGLEFQSFDIGSHDKLKILLREAAKTNAG